MTEWISVNDRLPEHKQRCLIWDRYSSSYVSIQDPETRIQVYAANFYKGEYKPNGPWSFCDSGFGNNQFSWAWKDGPHTWFSQDVTHWMPIPSPPQGTE